MNENHAPKGFIDQTEAEQARHEAQQEAYEEAQQEVGL